MRRALFYSSFSILNLIRFIMYSGGCLLLLSQSSIVLFGIPNFSVNSFCVIGSFPVCILISLFIRTVRYGLYRALCFCTFFSFAGGFESCPHSGGYGAIHAAPKSFV